MMMTNDTLLRFILGLTKYSLRQPRMPLVHVVRILLVAIPNWKLADNVMLLV